MTAYDDAETSYACLGCGRRVDADLEPSPGEPRRCADCEYVLQREAGVTWKS